MAKEKEPKVHQLYKQLSECNAQYRYPEASTADGTGWEVIAESSEALIVVNRTYIDLAGWSKQDLTMFTTGVDIQKMNTPLRTLATTGMLNVWEYDILTTRRITDTECNVGDTDNFAPGFLPSTVDLMQVIYGERVEYALNSTIGFTYVQVSAETFGSGNPTAMDKLHWTRIFVFLGNNTNLDQVTIFPSNLIVQALTVEEKDLVWMERLRRSYVLEDRTDV